MTLVEFEQRHDRRSLNDFTGPASPLIKGSSSVGPGIDWSALAATGNVKRCKRDLNVRHAADVPPRIHRVAADLVTHPVALPPRHGNGGYYTGGHLD